MCVHLLQFPHIDLPSMVNCKHIIEGYSIEQIQLKLYAKLLLNVLLLCIRSTVTPATRCNDHMLLFSFDSIEFRMEFNRSTL